MAAMVRKLVSERVAASERAIVAAKREFAAMGFAGVRMTKIAVEARCSLETIYESYGRKEDLFVASLNRALDFSEIAVRRVFESCIGEAQDPERRILDIMMSYCCPPGCEEYARLYLAAIGNPVDLSIENSYRKQALNVRDMLIPLFQELYHGQSLSGASAAGMVEAFVDLAIFRAAAAWSQGHEPNEATYPSKVMSIIKATLASFTASASQLQRGEGRSESAIKFDDINAESINDWLCNDLAVGAWEWRTSEKFIRCSKSWLLLNGIATENLIVPFEFVEKTRHRTDLDLAKAALKAHLSGETEFYIAEFRVTAPNGVKKWFLDKGCVVNRGEDGKPIRMVGLISDISDVRRL